MALVAVAVAYARRTSTLVAQGKAAPVWRQVCFGSGLLILFLADLPPLANVAEELILAHMAQHLLIGDLAALLITLGLTGPILAPVLRLRGLRWLRHLGNPLVALPVWALNLYLWHLGALYQGVLDSSALHATQHLFFLSFGVAMWMPLVGPLPTPEWFGNGAKLIYVIGVRFVGVVLGNVLSWAGSPLYPDYAPGQAKWDVEPLADQGAAGALMMVEGGIVTLGLFAWVFLRWAKQDTERQALLDLADRQGVPLDAARAGRAVAAGRSEELRERLRGSDT